jgi:hypothetical protein
LGLKLDKSKDNHCYRESNAGDDATPATSQSMPGLKRTRNGETGYTHSLFT